MKQIGGDNIKPLIIQNIQGLHGVSFLVTILYGSDGHKRDEIAKLYEGDAAAAIYSSIELATTHGLEDVCDYWTSSRELMATALSTVGVAPTMKPEKETHETHRTIHDHEELFEELYDLQPSEPTEKPQELHKWRLWLIKQLQKTINLLEKGRR